MATTLVHAEYIRVDFPTLVRQAPTSVHATHIVSYKATSHRKGTEPYAEAPHCHFPYKHVATGARHYIALNYTAFNYTEFN